MSLFHLYKKVTFACVNRYFNCLSVPPHFKFVPTHFKISGSATVSRIYFITKLHGPLISNEGLHLTLSYGVWLMEYLQG